MSKALVDLLVARPEKELLDLRARIREERESLREHDDRLKFEEQLLNDALAQGKVAAGANGSAPKPKVSREDVYNVIAQMKYEWVRPAQVRDAFHAQGIPVNIEALRQSMRRLVKDNKLTNDRERGYKISSPNGSLLDSEGAAL